MNTAYLFACGLGALIWTTFFWLRADLRKLMLTMSLIGLPLALSDLFYVPHYWRPKTLGNMPVGIEGFLFSFEAAGICSVAFAVAASQTIQCDTIPWRRLFRAETLIPFIPLPVSALVSIVLSTNLEWGLYAGLILALMATCLTRPDLAKPALIGGLTFLPIYWLALTIWVWAYPSVHDWFILWRMPHWYVLRVPLEEIVFGALFAAFWTGIYPLVFERRFKERTSRSWVRDETSRSIHF